MALFRRSPEAFVDPEPESATETVTTVTASDSPVQALWAEAQRLGFEVFPVGAWSETVGRLEARAEEAEGKFASAMKLVRTQLDAYWSAERRADRCEHEFSLLTTPALEAEIGAITKTEETPDD